MYIYLYIYIYTVPTYRVLYRVTLLLSYPHTLSVSVRNQKQAAVLSPSVPRCGRSVGGCHPHGVHGSHRVRADGPDLTHPARDDCGDPGQRRSPVPAALPLRLHHPYQEVAIPARAGLGTP